MFTRLDKADETDIVFSFDGREIVARSGDSVAAALLAAGYHSFRTTPVSGAERGPFCMMGACYDCLVEIDGVTLQACAVSASPGLQVERARSSDSARGNS